MFLDELITEIKTHEFYFDFLLATTVMFFWLRFLMMLKLTQTFGPVIETIIKMLYDMAIFFGLLIIVAITLSSIGVLLFSEL